MREAGPLAAAAARLLRQQVAGQPQLMEQLLTPVAQLTFDPDGRAEDLEATLQGITDRTPPIAQIRPRSSGPGQLEADISYENEADGPYEHRLLIRSMRDQQERPWTEMTCSLNILLGEEEYDLESMQETVNILNDRIPGGIWTLEAQQLTFRTGCCIQGSRVSDPEALARMAEHLLDAAAYGSGALDEEADRHPARERDRQNETFQDITGERYHIDLLQQQVEEWREQLPEQLRHAVQVHRADDGRRSSSIIIDLPGTAEEGQQHLRLLLDLPGPEERLPTIPQGIHAYSMMPGSFEDEQAGEWCRRLNSVGDGDDSIPVTTGWRHGNWYHTPDEDGGRRITYFGVIAHKFLHLCDLQTEVDGIVREICSNHSRISTSARYQRMLEEPEGGEE